MLKAGALFWVAELTDPNSGGPFAPAVYWNGHTRPFFDAVTTLDIHEALKFRDAASCQAAIDKLGPCKRGILLPTEHEMVDAPPPHPALPARDEWDEKAEEVIRGASHAHQPLYLLAAFASALRAAHARGRQEGARESKAARAALLDACRRVQDALQVAEIYPGYQGLLRNVIAQYSLPLGAGDEKP